MSFLNELFNNSFSIQIIVTQLYYFKEIRYLVAIVIIVVSHKQSLIRLRLIIRYSGFFYLLRFSVDIIFLDDLIFIFKANCFIFQA